jgi:hypothetical protein
MGPCVQLVRPARLICASAVGIQTDLVEPPPGRLARLTCDAERIILNRNRKMMLTLVSGAEAVRGRHARRNRAIIGAMQWRHLDLVRHDEIPAQCRARSSFCVGTDPGASERRRR